MNWSKVLQVLLAVMLAISGATKVQATALSGSGVPHVQACQSCHNAFATFNAVSLRYNCVSCHSLGGPAQKTAFSEEAMANPFGSTQNVAPLGEGSWRSHNWAAPLVNPKAGAVRPTNSNMTKQEDAGYSYFYDNMVTKIPQVTCARCHRIHAYEVVGQPLNVTWTYTLRDVNNLDQMCNNCHSPRVSTTSVNGSHPVSINYTSVWRTAKNADNTPKYTSFAQYTQSFYKAPRNRTATNRTSKLSNYYKGGNIVCSTCHDVHYGDSDSATFDNRSTTNGSTNTQMSHSNGMLLRTNQFGANADDINVCTNCHKDATGSKTRAHNNKSTANQNVQCVNCHEAHVPTVEGPSNTVIDPNQKLVARQMSYSTAQVNAKRKTVSFTAAAPFYKKLDGTGVCQTCHAVPLTSQLNPRTLAYDYPSMHNMSTARKSDCAGCHPHNGGKGGFSFDPVGCSQCHGYPPPVAAPQLLNYTTNENFTPHRVHSGGIATPTADLTKYGYGCVECHYSGLTSDHINGSVNMFKGSGPVGTKFGGAPVYNAATKTCSNVYCHSIGAPGDNNMTPGNTAQFKTTPSWKNGLNTLSGKCFSCHDDATALATGSHAKHVSATGAAYTCQTCHKDTVNGTNAIISKTKHANGNKDLGFLNNGTVTKTSGTITCSNTCHYNPDTQVKYGAVWGNAATGDCGTCHLTSPAISSASPGTIASKGHTAHLTSISGPKLGTALASCKTCHTAFPTTANTASHVNGTATYASSACFPCHPSSQGAPTWVQGSVSCRTCHVGITTLSTINGKGAAYFNGYSTAGHGVSFNSIGSVSGAKAKIDCNGCHDYALEHINPADTTKKRLKFATEKDACISCHNEDWTANSVVRTKLTTKTHMTATDIDAKNPTALCSACHEPHGTGNKRMIRDKIVFNILSAPVAITFTNATTGFVNLTTNRGLCQVCHTKTNHFKRGVAEPTTPGSHGDAEHRRCLQCHDHQPPESIGPMAFAPNGDCNSCHGYPPAKSMAGIGTHNNYSTARLETDPSGYVGGGGAHTVAGHIGKDVTVKNKTNANCTNCHSQFPTNHMANGNTVDRNNIQVVVNPIFKFNPTQPVQYNKSTNTCSNVSCHYQTTPLWQ